MEKITKKEFLCRHKSGKLLLQWVLNNEYKLSYLEQLLDNVSDKELNNQPVSNVNVSSDKMQTITVYKHNKFYLVKNIIDNSKNPDCSWDDIDTSYIVYSNNN